MATTTPNQPEQPAPDAGPVSRPRRYRHRGPLLTPLAAGLVGLLLMLLSSCVNPPPRPTESGPAVNTAALDRMLARQWQATGLPGMAVVVARGDDVVYLGGFGSDGHGRAVTADTLFMIASLTKSFTAVAVLQLVEKRKVVSDRWFTR